MKVEILAPGGSKEGVISAINAGADAVYTGGKLFGAREFANNLDTNDMLEVIDYAHLHNRKIYLTVNTLLKDKEIEKQLYEYILPFYRRGLDAVIVQDYGVMQFIHDYFPDLPIHASTQMTIMGKETAKYLKDFGVRRIVTPRELNLGEINEIYKETDLEIESFVHGALCYCYSGQCFLSSYIGGRSGNRGKCAQPCRLNYDLLKGNDIINKGNNKYILSPKDICTLKILPDIIESGVCSLKIEGRMKKPEYAAGITSIYRKYVDMYLKYGRDGYKVDDVDIEKAADLFNRNGFSESYYNVHNSRDMISLKEPKFRQENKEFINFINTNYINNRPKEKINIFVKIKKDINVNVVLVCDEISVEIDGNMPGDAINSPITKEAVIKQFSKLGNTPFILDNIDVEIDEGLFVTVGELNNIRRNAITKLQEAIVSKHYRNIPNVNAINQDSVYSKTKLSISALSKNYRQSQEIINSGKVNRIYLEMSYSNLDNIESIAKLADKGKVDLYVAFPYVFREKDKEIFSNKYKKMIEYAQGALIRNIEEYFYAKKYFNHLKYTFDYNVYTFNTYSKDIIRGIESGTTTVPVELNYKELQMRKCDNEEMVVYGYMPVMISANCVAKTMNICNKSNEQYKLKDRMNKIMSVQCNCDFCYNVIYNSSPLSLIKYGKEIKELNLSSVRLEFTNEDSNSIKNIINSFYATFIDGKNAEDDIIESTRGHFNRGVK